MSVTVVEIGRSTPGVYSPSPFVSRYSSTATPATGLSPVGTPSSFVSNHT